MLDDTRKGISQSDCDPLAGDVIKIGGSVSQCVGERGSVLFSGLRILTDVRQFSVTVRTTLSGTLCANGRPTKGSSGLDGSIADLSTDPPEGGAP